VNEGAAWVTVVDDDPVNRALLTRFLEQDGYRVDTAGDGGDALGKTRGSGCFLFGRERRSLCPPPV
jgi:CheY-like chemotaxis protein